MKYQFKVIIDVDETLFSREDVQEYIKTAVKSFRFSYSNDDDRFFIGGDGDVTVNKGIRLTLMNRWVSII